MSFSAQVWHVFAKDVRRFWPLLAGLVALVLGHRFFALPLPRSQFTMGVQVDVFSLVCVGIAAVVVQDDPVVSDRAGWLTTPLRPLAVLFAKVIFAGSFLVAFPALIQVEWLAGVTGTPFSSALLADTLLFQGALVAIAVLGAALTPNLGAFLILAVGVLAFDSALGRPLPVNAFSSLEEGVRETRTYLTQWHWILGTTAVLVMHYLHRRALVSALIAMVIWLPGRTLIERSDFSLLPAPFDPAERVHYDADFPDVRLAALDWSVENSTGDRHDFVFAVFETFADGAPYLVDAGISGGLFESRALVRSDANGPSERTRSWSPSFQRGLPGFDPALAAQRQVPVWTFSVLAQGSYSDIVALADVDSLSLTWSADVYEERPLIRLPLEAGASWRGDSESVTLLAVARVGGGLAVEMEVVRAVRGLSLKHSGRSRSLGWPYLVHPIYGTFVSPTGSANASAEEGTRPKRSLALGSELVVDRRRIVFDPSLLAGSSNRRLPEDWFEGAEFVITLPEYLGTIQRPFELRLPAWPAEGRRVDLEREGES